MRTSVAELEIEYVKQTMNFMVDVNKKVELD